MVRFPVWVLLASMGAAGCGGGDETEDPSGGAGAAGGSASSAAANGGQGGATGSGSGPASGGAGGSSNGGQGPGGAGSGGEGGNADPQSSACQDFPATVVLGPTIVSGTLGAVLCLEDAASICRLTTNTYGDGVNPCPDPDRVANFLSSDGGHTVTLNTLGGSTWTFVSSSAGTIDPAAPYYLPDLPDGTAIAVVIEETASAAQHTVAFRFDGSDSFTITSFEPVQ